MVLIQPQAAYDDWWHRLNIG